MLTYNGQNVRTFSFTAKLITTGGELTVRAFKTMDEEVKVIGYNDHEEIEKSFEKTFYTVEEFYEWYFGLHIKREVKVNTIVE